MEKKKGTVKINRDGKKIFRFVDIAFSHEDDEVYFKEIPILGETSSLIENGSYEMELVTNDGILCAKEIHFEYPHDTYFPDIMVMDVVTKETHKVCKFLGGDNGEISVWCYTWYGKHVIGQDCVFIRDLYHG